MIRGVALAIVLATFGSSSSLAASTDGTFWVHIMAADGTPLPDACVEIYADAGNSTPGAFRDGHCDKDDGARDGTIVLAVPVGAYVLVETVAPTGYDLPTTGTPRQIEAGETQDVIIENTPIGGPTGPATPRPEAETSPGPASGDFEGRVDIGGRSLFLNCTGSGEPTVLLEAGGPGLTSDSWAVVQPDIARVARTCSYDRAFLGKSDPAPEGPRTIENSVNDLHALLTAAGIKCPCVFVGASWGGAIVRLYADRFPDDVGGVVFVDAIPPGFVEQFRSLVKDDTPESQRLLGVDGYEHVDQLSSLQMADEAAPPAGVPALVLTHGRDLGFDVSLPGNQLETAWRDAQVAYANALGARLIVAGKSGSDLVQEQPDVVVAGITYIVASARSPETSSGTIRVRTTADDGTGLAGACYEIYDDAGNGEAGTYRGGACDNEDGAIDGTVVFVIGPGSYFLREAQSPQGYDPGDDATATVRAGSVVDVLVVNRRSTATPVP